MHDDRNESDYHDIDFGQIPPFMSEVFFLLLLQCVLVQRKLQVNFYGFFLPRF